MENILHYFKKNQKFSTGIHLGDEAIYCTRAEEIGDGEIVVTLAEKIKCDLNDRQGLLEGLDELCNILNKDGISGEDVTLCVDENEVFYYHRVFNDVDEKDLMSEIRWDISSNEPFEGEFMAAYCREENLLGAVSQQEIMNTVETLRHGDIHVIRVTTSAGRRIYIDENSKVILGNISCNLPERFMAMFTEEGQLLSLYGAVTGLREQGLIFPLENSRLQDWQWMRIGACAVILSCLLSLVASAWYEWELYTIRQELKTGEQQFTLLQDAWDSKQRTDFVNENVLNKAKYMKELAQGSLPMYAIMVHLGCNTVEGAWLTDVIIGQEHQLELKGEAASYNSVVKYYQLLEKDDDFFVGAAKLEKSEMLPNGKISFQIRMEI